MAKLELKLARSVMAAVESDYDEKSPKCCWCQLVPRDHPTCARGTPEGKERIQRLLKDAAAECGMLRSKIDHLVRQSTQAASTIFLQEYADYEALHIECVQKEIARLEKLLLE